VAFSLSQTILFLLNYLFYSRVVSPLPLGQAFVRPLLASLGMGAVLLAVKGLNIFLVCGIGVLVYPPLLFLFRALTVEDFAFLRGIGELRRGSGEAEEKSDG